MSLEQFLPETMTLPLSIGRRPAFQGDGIEMLTGIPKGECTCGKCEPIPPHVSVVITHPVGAAYFVALPKAYALRVARQMLEFAEALPGPTDEPEIAGKKGNEK